MPLTGYQSLADDRLAERQHTGRWSVEEAKGWHEKQPWLVGCNFIPSTAINQLEMWQADTFDPETIDRELGWAAGIGFNAVRVYLHDLAYDQDPDGLLQRMDRFLRIADAHGIKTLFVIFDDCWLAEPKAGKQPEPWPGLIGQNKWYIYGDPFHSPMEAWETTDFVKFKRIVVKTVPGSKHCSMFPTTETELRRLCETYPGPSPKNEEAEKDVRTLLPHGKQKPGTMQWKAGRSGCEV